MQEVLECSEFRPFWLIFDVDGFIKLGEGLDLGLNELMATQDQAVPYHVTSYSLTTSAANNAEFKIYKSSGLKIHNYVSITILIKFVFYLSLNFSARGSCEDRVSGVVRAVLVSR